MLLNIIGRYLGEKKWGTGEARSITFRSFLTMYVVDFYGL